MWRSFTFVAAAPVFEDLFHRSLDPHRAVKSRLFSKLCEGLNAWSLFEYQQALQQIDSIFNQPSLGIHSNELSDLKQLLSEQKASLEALTRPSPSLQDKGIDLYCNALLKYHMKAYTDCLWRCAAVCEQLMTSHVINVLQQRTGLTPSTLRFRQWLTNNREKHQLLGQLSAELYERIDPSGRVRSEIPAFLSPAEAAKILSWLKEGFGNSLDQQARELWDLRNEAIHHMEPVTDSEAKSGIDVAQRMLVEVYSSSIQVKLRSYPFAVEQLHQLAQLAERFV